MNSMNQINQSSPQVNLINPFDKNYSLAYFISKQQYLNDINIAFGGYYNYFKTGYIIDTHQQIINKEHNISSITVYPSTDHFYNNIRILIGKFYLMTVNGFHKYLINNTEVNISTSFTPFDELIKEHSILHNNVLLLYPTQYLQLQTKDYIVLDDIETVKKMYVKLMRNKINEESIKKLNKREYELLLKLSISKKKDDIVKMLLNNEHLKECTECIEYLMKNNIEMFKSIKDINTFINKDGFNMLELAIINGYVDVIMYLKDMKFDRSSYYIETSYNTHYINYDESKMWLEKNNIPKKIKNCKFLNSLIIDEMLNHGLFDETYDYINHHFDYFDISLLCDMLVRNHASLTVKLLLKNNKLMFNKYVVGMLIKLQLEDFTINEQKEVFLNNTEYILNLMIEDEKVWKRFSEKKYLNLLNHNFIINSSYDNILHLLIKHEYKEHHDEILMTVIGINPNVINNVNCRNENCVFEMINKKMINKIIAYGCDDVMNVDGDYLVHKLIRMNDFNLLFSILSTSQSQLNLRNTYNETPIILAAKMKKSSIVNYLFKMKCDMKCCDYFGNSCYHYIMINKLSVCFDIDNSIDNKFNNKSFDYWLTNIINSF